MSDGIATSYYKVMPEHKNLKFRLDLLAKFNYWTVRDCLLFMRRANYEMEALDLIRHGEIKRKYFGVAVRYSTKNGHSSFDISPDDGKSYLNYLRTEYSGENIENKIELAYSIATIEAMVLTKFYFSY
jgi:hypothetical protein